MMNYYRLCTGCSLSSQYSLQENNLKKYFQRLENFRAPGKMFTLLFEKSKILKTQFAKIFPGSWKISKVLKNIFLDCSPEANTGS